VNGKQALDLVKPKKPAVHFDEYIDAGLLGKVLRVWNYFETFQGLLNAPKFSKEDLWTALVWIFLKITIFFCFKSRFTKERYFSSSFIRFMPQSSRCLFGTSQKQPKSLPSKSQFITR
jgi:hypothetical protein